MFNFILLSHFIIKIKIGKILVLICITLLFSNLKKLLKLKTFIQKWFLKKVSINKIRKNVEKPHIFIYIIYIVFILNLIKKFVIYFLYKLIHTLIKY